MEAASVFHCSRTSFLGKHHNSCQRRFGTRPLSRLALAITLTLVAPPASAQLVGGRSVQATGCASAAIGGDVRDTTITTVCGMPPEQVVELVRLAASPQAGDRAELSNERLIYATSWSRRKRKAQAQARRVSLGGYARANPRRCNHRSVSKALHGRT
jgi:hypothetical protein